MMLAKIAALIASEARGRLVDPVVAEYRTLTKPPVCERPHSDERPAYDPSSTLSAHIERVGADDHEATPAVTATTRPTFGFGR
jgi:hypothetical protein